tara:strand:+ start:122 stop:646 length:525 start_codon:yes stop_codon:yes gene_type:complete
MTMVMNLDRLREIVGAYGAAAHRWPVAERAAALALVAESAEARVLLDDALQLDLMLDAAPAAEPASDMLIARIMAARPRAVAAPRVAVVQPVPHRGLRALLQALWPYGPAAFPAGALAASIMLGVSFGATATSTMTSLGLTGTTQTVASANTSEFGEQLVAIAFAENVYPEEWQ